MCSARKLLASAALVALVGLGCQRTDRYPVGEMSKAPLIQDEAMALRQWSTVKSEYGAGYSFSGPTYFPYRISDDANYAESLVGEPLLFYAQTLTLPVAFFVTPPLKDVYNRGVYTPPTYTAVPAAPNDAGYFSDTDLDRLDRMNPFRYRNTPPAKRSKYRMWGPNKLELEEPRFTVEKPRDLRPRLEQPLPVYLEAIADLHLPRPAANYKELAALYVKLLEFAPGATEPEIIFRAENFSLIFDQPRIEGQPDYRPIRVVVLSLTDAQRKLVEAEVEFTRQPGLLPGTEMLLLQDRDGNWVELREHREIV